VLSIPLDARILTIVDNISLDRHAVPEPTTWLLLCGLFGLALLPRRKSYIGE
jgi:hypothetical protein